MESKFHRVEKSNILEFIRTGNRYTGKVGCKVFVTMLYSIYLLFVSLSGDIDTARYPTTPVPLAQALSSRQAYVASLMQTNIYRRANSARIQLKEISII